MTKGVASRWFDSSFAKRGLHGSPKNESIMDFSNSNGLCDEIWDYSDGKYSIKKDVAKKLLEAADWAIEKYGLKHPIVRLIGSICSNAYEKTTDLDIHITDTSLDKAKRDDMNTEMRKEFKKRTETDADANRIGEHPIELYIQENAYRDLLSVGCYNLRGEEWECGPTEYPDGYDPYATYFNAIYSTHSDLIENVRDTVMKTVEMGYATMLADGKSEEDFSDKIAEVISNSAKYLEECRNMRGALSEPKSEREAEQIRTSEEWKLADATFKLMGKYGYIPFMKNVADIDKGIDKDSFSNKIIELAEKKLFRKSS